MIQTNGLSKQFGSLKAVEDLTLTVPAGQLFGFLGPNGAGKTTTIQMIVGLLRPSAGSVHVAGYNVQDNPLIVKRQIGYLAQRPLLYDKLTGREFLLYIGGLYGLPDAVIAERTAELMTLVDLAEKADAVIESYSGGMRHKIGLCAALLHNPQVLVLDEPLAGLDPYSARRVKDVLRLLCGQGVTVFLSTHILEIAERVCDRVGILDQGRLIAQGTMAELRDQVSSGREATLEDLFLDLTGGAAVADLADMLAR